MATETGQGLMPGSALAQPAGSLGQDASKPQTLTGEWTSRIHNACINIDGALADLKGFCDRLNGTQPEGVDPSTDSASPATGIEEMGVALNHLDQVVQNVNAMRNRIQDMGII